MAGAKRRGRGRAGEAEEHPDKIGPRVRTVGTRRKNRKRWRQRLPAAVSPPTFLPPPVFHPPRAREPHVAHRTAHAGRRLNSTSQRATAAGSHDAGATRGRGWAWADGTRLPRICLPLGETGQSPAPRQCTAPPRPCCASSRRRPGFQGARGQRWGPQQ